MAPPKSMKPQVLTRIQSLQVALCHSNSDDAASKLTRSSSTMACVTSENMANITDQLSLSETIAIIPSSQVELSIGGTDSGNTKGLSFAELRAKFSSLSPSSTNKRA